MTTKTPHCSLCEMGLPKYYMVSVKDPKTNQTVIIKMSEKQRNQYLELLKEVEKIPEEDKKNVTIELHKEGYAIKWNE